MARNRLYRPWELTTLVYRAFLALSATAALASPYLLWVSLPDEWRVILLNAVSIFLTAVCATLGVVLPFYCLGMHVPIQCACCTRISVEQQPGETVNLYTNTNSASLSTTSSDNDGADDDSEPSLPD